MSGLTAATLNTAGVQQGDPFGPAGFALALHSLVEKLQDTVSPQVWHLDDSHILATRLQLHAAITEIQRQGTPLGIPLNPKKKCRLWDPGAQEAYQIHTSPTVPFLQPQW